MDAGLLRYNMLDIYSPQVIKDEFGYEKEIYTISYENIRCYIAKTQEKREVDATEIEYPITKTFSIRRHWKYIIDEKCRIKYDNRFYRIDSVDSRIENNCIVIEATKINV